MTTTVPKIYAFHEFSDVAEAVADYVVYAQNHALSKKTKNDRKHSNTSLNSINSTSGRDDLNNLIIPNTATHPNHLKKNKGGITPSPNDNGHLGSHTSSHANSLSGNLDPAMKNYSNINMERDNGNTKETKESPLNVVKERRFRIALSGGSLIQVLQEGLLKRDDVQWGKWDIYFADERLVPFNSENSNYGLAKRNIFDQIDTKKFGKPKVYHVNEKLINDPQECADNYEKILIKGFAGRDSVKLPMFDLFLLGCAPDGHIASLFPNFQETLREKLAWVVPVEGAPSGPENRISLTIPVICHSHRVAFVVEGATKAPVLKTIMERPEKGLPSSIVNEGAAGRVSWFVDLDALSDVFVTKKTYKFRSAQTPTIV